MFGLRCAAGARRWEGEGTYRKEKGGDKKSTVCSAETNSSSNSLDYYLGRYTRIKFTKIHLKYVCTVNRQPKTIFQFSHRP